MNGLTSVAAARADLYNLLAALPDVGLDAIFDHEPAVGNLAKICATVWFDGFTATDYRFEVRLYISAVDPDVASAQYRLDDYTQRMEDHLRRNSKWWATMMNVSLAEDSPTLIAKWTLHGGREDIMQ